MYQLSGLLVVFLLLPLAEFSLQTIQQLLRLVELMILHLLKIKLILTYLLLLTYHARILLLKMEP